MNLHKSCTHKKRLLVVLAVLVGVVCFLFACGPLGENSQNEKPPTDKPPIERPPLTGDTSPSAARSRVEKYLSRQDFETLFPTRFGSLGWKARPETKIYYSQQDIDAMPEYYSYDNLLDAVEWLAGHIYVIEWRQDQYGDKPLVSYAPRQSAIDKATGKTIRLNTEPDFDAEWNATKPIFRLEIDYGAFLADGNDNMRRRELAGFLANASHETGEVWWDAIDKTNGGLYWNEEIAHIGGYTDNYTDNGNTSFAPVKGKSYHGRGPFQLSWNYNYGLFGGIVYGDKSVLLQEPERVVQDGKLGWMSALWFWMTPQYPKGSCHEVITDTWTPLRNSDKSKYTPGFGLTIVIINGGFESDKAEGTYPQVDRRISYYRKFAQFVGADINGEKVDTKGMMAWT